MNLYITADQIGIQSGGGRVTLEESEALKTMGPCDVWGREQLPLNDPVFGAVDQWAYEEPWRYDFRAMRKLVDAKLRPEIAHFYAGTFSHAVAHLQAVGCKVVYTAAAHDIATSRKAHEELGVLYNYPHLTDPVLWERYVRGYLEADVLVCPSKHSADVMRGFGAKNRIEVIPHGVDLSKCLNCEGEGKLGTWAGEQLEFKEYACSACNGTGIAPASPLPTRFIVGTMGAIAGPDKGLIDLLRAWKLLNYRDALMVLGGSQSASPWVQQLIDASGASNVVCTGWLDDVSAFYDSLSLYVQPSRSEGFGCEVLEAMAYGRPVLCSVGAGAADLVPLGWTYPAGNMQELMQGIADAKNASNGELMELGQQNRIVAGDYTWPKIRERYVKLWREVLNEKRA